MPWWWGHLAGTVEAVVYEAGDDRYLPHCREVGQQSITLGKEEVDSPEGPTLRSILSHLLISKAQPRLPPLYSPTHESGLAERPGSLEGFQAEASGPTVDPAACQGIHCGRQGALWIPLQLTFRVVLKPGRTATPAWVLPAVSVAPEVGMWVIAEWGGPGLMVGWGREWPGPGRKGEGPTEGGWSCQRESGVG